MPAYTARVFITRKTKIQEEIWLEDIRAGSEAAAWSKANAKCVAYLNGLKDDDKPPTGYSIEFCMRTNLVTPDKVKPREQQALMLPQSQGQAMGRNRKKSVKVVKLKLNTKMFKKEIKGNFSDPYTFAAPLLVRVKVPPNPTWGYSRY